MMFSAYPCRLESDLYYRSNLRRKHTCVSDSGCFLIVRTDRLFFFTWSKPNDFASILNFTCQSYNAATKESTSMSYITHIVGKLPLWVLSSGLVISHLLHTLHFTFLYPAAWSPLPDRGPLSLWPQTKLCAFSIWLFLSFSTSAFHFCFLIFVKAFSPLNLAALSVLRGKVTTTMIDFSGIWTHILTTEPQNFS